MITVTTEDLEQADAQAAQAAGELRDAEREYASNRTSRTAYERHQEAVEAADHAAVRARLLRADWEEQEAVRRLRAQEAEALMQELAVDVAGLADTRTAAVAAVVVARSALREALAALGAHDARVRAGQRFTERGLRRLDGEETGAGMDGSVWLRGQLWPLVDGGGVMARVLADLVGEGDRRHPAARGVLAPYGGATAARGRDEVLASVRAERGR
ncbi:hypothetical protein [Streptomyces griseorubiginosus]|uniref:hypothetical protein n=1 Tax=Streptomyces griseorubiginosus TaxID=67304 RepID=UPI0036E7A978